MTKASRNRSSQRSHQQELAKKVQAFQIQLHIIYRFCVATYTDDNMGLRLLHVVLVLLLVAGVCDVANIGELLYCIEGERPQLKEPLTDATYSIFSYVQGESDRQRARHCLWVIKPPRGQSGSLLLELRHWTRPVAAGVDFMPNLTLTLLHQSDTRKLVQFHRKFTVLKSIWMNWTDRLEIRLDVDNASAAGLDNDLYLFGSFATKHSCSDKSQLHYNSTCYKVYRPVPAISNNSNSRNIMVIPAELAAGFKTVDELLEFRKLPELEPLMPPVLVITGVQVSCNGTQLLHLITTDAECKWTPMEGNMSAVIQWSTNLTTQPPQSCEFLTLHLPTEPSKPPTFGCVSSDEATQLPQLLAVNSAERHRRLDSPQLSADIINGCHRGGVVGSDTVNKTTLAVSLAVVLTVVLLIALSIGIGIGIGICLWLKRRRSGGPSSTANGGTGALNGEAGHRMLDVNQDS